ncbi:MAG TPA: class I SAM-dependent methyltransferase [Lacipirellulaceae bacterium]|nr:class I SAM-dependent methyltransferase [Lacipirellulaceae bacterium]
METKQRKRGIRALNRMVENDFIHRVTADEYREKVKDVYGGPQGAFLATASRISMHVSLGRRLFRTRKFDLRAMKSILDVGSGAGQIAGHLLDYADPDAQITCIDLSQQMLRRARQRLKSNRPSYVVADVTALPFADSSFDGITCGYVLEHLPDPLRGLGELARVLRPGGRMFLLTTEDNFSGAWTSRLWYCRTYNRRELMQLCESLRLRWKTELWFTPIHRAIRAGGICVEIEKV